MSTGPETEVISCPACNHLVRVPLDWLGEPVQCPECRAKFRAPTRDSSGALSTSVLITVPGPRSRGEPRPLDVMLLLPAYGLLVLGFAGTVVNIVMGYRFWADPNGAEEYIRGQLPQLRQYGIGEKHPPAEQAQRDAELAARTVRLLRWVVPSLALASTLTFLGGLSIALRWKHSLAQLGCVAASLNLNGLCCVPGALMGLWGLLMLRSEEGRGHFE